MTSYSWRKRARVVVNLQPLRLLQVSRTNDTELLTSVTFIFFPIFRSIVEDLLVPAPVLITTSYLYVIMKIYSISAKRALTLHL